MSDALEAVLAFDLQTESVLNARGAISDRFAKEVPGSEAERIAENWVQAADFLLRAPDDERFDFVVGNPPYIRLEDVAVDRLRRYKQSCTTMAGRADIYLGFFELGLRSLSPDGVLGYICADRWMRNAYGKRLRQLVRSAFSVEASVEMHDVDAFEKEVASYPAVTVIRRAPQGNPVIATTDATFDAAAAEEVVAWAKESAPAGNSRSIGGSACVARLAGWFDTDEPWPTGSPERLDLLRRLEAQHSPLETDGTKVGIGVATGADGVFIVDAPVVEESRLVPLAMTSDITDGSLKWGGRYLVNPWERPRQLIDLDRYPLTRDYFVEHRVLLGGRHVASRRPQQWYRTIDPVHEHLTGTPKLLLPDMKLNAHPVLDPGGHYPHHNLYYVTSSSWDLEVLGGLLLSRVAQFFIESYAVRMRGGTLRFQAQYLRRIRVPEPPDPDSVLGCGLTEAFRARDVDQATNYALQAYGIKELPE